MAATVLGLLRQLPVNVSRRPVEAILVALVLASLCYYRVVHVLGPRSLTVYDNGNSDTAMLTLDGLLSGTAVTAATGAGRFLVRGHDLVRPVVTDGDADMSLGDAPAFTPYRAIRQLFVVGPRADPRGALTRTSMRKLQQLQAHVESDGFLRIMKRQRYSFKSMCHTHRDKNGEGASTGALASASACMVLSPLEMYWDGSIDAFNADEHPVGAVCLLLSTW